MSQKSICIFGLGHVGLPTACLFATKGYNVIGVDSNKEVVAKVSQGEAPFKEPGLQELLQNSLASNSLIVKEEPEAANIFLIATGTPLDEGAKVADLRYLEQAVMSISHLLEEGDLVILESTVPLGAIERLILPILEQRSGLKEGKTFYLAYCPERAIPGNIIHELTHNDRVIGSIARKSAGLAKELYSCFVKGDFYLTDLRTAEMVKLIENTFRYINIAVANEFAQIAAENGANIWEAIELANKHPRVNILSPGPGVGGYCLPKDPWFLVENSASSRIIPIAREINEYMPSYVLGLVEEFLREIEDATITILGVAYKGNVDDALETPALKFIKKAENKGYKIKIHDPLVKEFEYELLPLEMAVQDSDCLVLLTDHSRFKEIAPEEVGRLMRSKNVVDTKNILDHQRWRRAEFNVKVMGHGR